MADEWTVVGASGRAKLPKSRPNTTAATGAGLSSAATAQEPQQLPGWAESIGVPGWTHSEHVTQQHRSRKKKHRERTFDEQIEHLSTQVMECRHLVSQSRFYQNLKAAITTSSGHCLRSPTTKVPAELGLPGDAVAHIDLTQPLSEGSVAGQTFDSHVAHESQKQQSMIQENCTLHSACVQQQTHGADNLQEQTGPGPSSTNSHSRVTKQPPQSQVSPTANSNGWNSQIQHLVCYGLGSPQDSRTSRYQLALLLLISQDLLPGLTAQPEAYDPCFTNVDKALLQRLGINIIDEDEKCARHATQPTFFWLPHLEGHMCDNLLAANWTASGGMQQTDDDRGDATGHTLSQCVILGNSFKTYQQRWELWGGSKQQPQSKQQQSYGGSTANNTCGDHEQQLDGRPRRPDAMLQLLAEGKVMELPVSVERDFPEPSAFNDTSLHLFHP